MSESRKLNLLRVVVIKGIQCISATNYICCGYEAYLPIGKLLIVNIKVNIGWIN